MIVGVPREIKSDEYRVAMTPNGVEELTRAGHKVLTESGAGVGSGITDDMYAANGAEIVASTPDIWKRSEMVVKVKGEFNWHSHPDTDDFFLVLKGELDIQLRDRTVNLKAGEMFIVPKGVEHRPVAREEVHLLLIEPTGTPNTGDPATAAKRQVI